MGLTLVDILGEHWPEFARTHRAHLSSAHYRAVRCALACRTPQMGGCVYRCGQCHKVHFAYHSCNHRNCPQCGAQDQQVWTAKQEARLLKVPYFMVTFTIPAELRGICQAYPATLYHLLLSQSAAALKDVMETKHHGAQCGFTSVLHTWGRQMQHHPHIHCIVPALAYDPTAGELILPNKDSFLIHYKPLAARFRSLLESALRTQHPDIYATLSAKARNSLSAHTQWNVNLRHVGNGSTAIRYLARYVHRSAFSPNRLLGYDHAGNIRLRWTCSTTKRQGILTLTPQEFLRRWLLHVLPKGFTRIRHYGFLSSAARKARLRIRLLLGQGSEPAPDLPASKPFPCSACGADLIIVLEFARINPSRGPPACLPDLTPLES